ncbi:MAG: class I SAM-dependent methyltransferase [Candidatus Diapherotrites archaeon]
MGLDLKKLERNQCRVCGNANLDSILSLGDLYISDFTDTGEGQDIVPLELVLCDSSKGGCGLLQLKHTVPGDNLYRNYWYKSGVNQSMRTALRDIVEKAERLVKLEAGDLVLDIGANDGTLLRAYSNPYVLKVGFEPAKNLLDEAKVGTTKILNDYFNFQVVQREFGNKKAKVITSIAMFYDLDDPNKFVNDVRRSLDKDGVWVIQMAYLPMMLESNAFDNICHEHLEYYSLHSLENLLARHSLEVFDMETNDVNGGSYRVYIQHEGAGFKALPENGGNLEKFRKMEEELELNSRKPYDAFAQRVESLKKKCVEFISQERKKAKKVFVYGASTKGNTLLQYYGLDSTVIEAAAERNPAKYGMKTIGTKIPILSEQDCRDKKPDYFLVLPWHFKGEFVKRENEYLQNGGKLIFPLPEFEVVSK